MFFILLTVPFARSYTLAKQKDDSATVFAKKLRDVEKDDKDASKLVMRHFKRSYMQPFIFKITSPPYELENSHFQLAFSTITVFSLPL